MQPKTRNKNSLSIFPYHVHKQADFEYPFINGRDFIYLGIFEDEFHFLSIYKSSR